MKGTVLKHHVFKHIDAQIGGRFLRDRRQYDRAHDTGNCADNKDYNQRDTDPDQQVTATGHKDIVEHRLHHVTDRAQHRPFQSHEEYGQQKQAVILPEIASP